MFDLKNGRRLSWRRKMQILFCTYIQIIKYNYKIIMGFYEKKQQVIGSLHNKP